MSTTFEQLDKNKRFNILLEEYKNYSPDNDKTGEYGILIINRILPYFGGDLKKFNTYYKLRKLREKYS
jgi:hypothetical protein